MIKDMYENCEIEQVLDPAVVAADANCSSVDLQGYECVTFFALIGEGGVTLGTGVTIEVEVEESDDDSSFTDVADADLSNYVDGTNDGCMAFLDALAEEDSVYTTTYRGNKRYVRPVLNFTGTHGTGTAIGIVAVKQGYKYPPVG